MDNVLNDNSNLSEYVVEGAITRCSLGSRKSEILMPNSHGIFLKEKPQCTIYDKIPIENIAPFGGCRAIITCTPNIVLPWVNKKDTTLVLNDEKALIEDAVCFCTHGGIIEIEHSGQM